MFKIHSDAPRWGERLLKGKESPVSSFFDIYYLSFIVGIGLGRSPIFESSQVTEFNRTYTSPFEPYRYVLSGLLLVSELSNSGLELNKATVQKLVGQIINSNSPTFLSDEAVDLMNRYAYGGFEALREEQPKSADAQDFLIWYYEDMLPRSYSGF